MAYDLLLGNSGRAILIHFGVNYADQNPQAVHNMLSHPTSGCLAYPAREHVPTRGTCSRTAPTLSS